MKTTKTNTMTATVLAAKGTGGCRKGPWMEQEDMKLIWFVRLFSERRWDLLAKVSGLNRTGKSCRLRWVNYLDPNLKRGRMSPDEERLVIGLHAKWGNRWSHIAKSMPGRTDNEIKNYWRTHTRKTTRAAAHSASASACTTTSMSISASSSSFNSSSDHTHHGEEENEGDQLLYTAGVSTMDDHLLWNDVIVDTYACWSGGMDGSALPSVMVAPSSPVWDYCCPDSLWG